MPLGDYGITAAPPPFGGWDPGSRLPGYDEPLPGGPSGPGAGGGSVPRGYYPLYPFSLQGPQSQRFTFSPRRRLQAVPEGVGPGSMIQMRDEDGGYYGTGYEGGTGGYGDLPIEALAGATGGGRFSRMGQSIRSAVAGGARRQETSAIMDAIRRNLLSDFGARERSAELSAQLFGGGDPYLTAWGRAEGQRRAQSDLASALSEAELQSLLGNEQFMRQLALAQLQNKQNERESPWPSVLGDVFGAVTGGFLGGRK